VSKFSPVYLYIPMMESFFYRSGSFMISQQWSYATTTAQFEYERFQKDYLNPLNHWCWDKLTPCQVTHFKYTDCKCVFFARRGWRNVSRRRRKSKLEIGVHT